ncbi:MAG: 3-ketoacyl-ACP reductase [Treponema sp.]|jgi:NAD(P)-dependent dehydrogenase (short-subunit alcohol dehydrogenase family)|nr:3-ketoacyl-ACP reductase [Treponema sp.]
MKKIVIVTGGTRGIGFAVSARLGEDGFALALVGTREEGSCRQSLEALKALAPDILYIQADVSKGEDRKRIVEKTMERFGAIHVLVNNAGVAPKSRTDLLEMTEESYDLVMNTNTKAVMFLTQLVVKRMLSQAVSGGKRGTVINIGSCSAEVSSVNRGEYCVSKAGISMLTKLYADRLAREGIFVHEIRPGIIKTDMTAGVTEKYDGLIEAGAFPIRRWGTPEDVAKAVAAFAGDNFLYTTGNVVDVDGGFHIRRL